VPDLGANVIWVFRFDQTSGMLTMLEEAAVEISPEAGPRHLIFHPNGQHAYLANELNNTVSVFALGQDGYSLDLQQELPTLPSDFSGNSSVADIHITPDGRNLYVSNRGHDSLAHFQVGENGELTPTGQTSVSGSFPRNFVIHPDGKSLYVANQNTDNIVHFTIDADTGELTEQGQYQTPTPVCLQFRKMLP
jgi:6-phosphogluconolactonase